MIAFLMQSSVLGISLIQDKNGASVGVPMQIVILLKIGRASCRERV